MTLAVALAAAAWLGPREHASAASPGIWNVPAQMDLQQALDQARPGDTIVLEAGRTYVGPFVLRRHAGSDAWITIRGDRALDGAGRRRSGRRVSPAAAPDMPSLVSASGSVLVAEPGAHHYRLQGLERAPQAGAALENVIDLGTSAARPDETPHDFVLDQLYVHGDPARGSRRGLALNSAATTVSNSYFADFKERGADSQAICGWNGPGPFSITNNYLEAAGENLMFGGADPRMPDLVPSDIVIADNDLSKPLAWRDQAQPWSVKNLLELKNARRVTIERNTLEHSWTAAQVGFAVLFTPRNQDGAAPWSTVEDVTFQHNIVRHVSGGVHLLGRDDIHDSRPLRRVRIADNLFQDVTTTWGSGRLFQIIDGTTDVTIDHNTASPVETAVFAGETVPHTGFRFTNNLIVVRRFGIIGSGTAPGTASLDRYFPNAVVRANALVGDSAAYPAGNFLLASPEAAGLVDVARGDDALTAASPLRGKATDGRDVGVDFEALGAASGRALPREAAAGLVLTGGIEVAFWTTCFLIAYVYVGYPIGLWLVARRRGWPVRAGRLSPDLTIVVVAYNEAVRIRRRLENLLATVYPGRRSIILVSDGSTDDTARIARGVSPLVTVVELPARRGKPAALNAVVPGLDSEIVVFADARQRFEPDAVRALVADFADPAVGMVSGQLVVGAVDAGAPDVARGTGLYWRYETCIRRWESLVHSTVGVTGAITAMRRGLFERLPDDTVLDDVLMPLRVMRRGYRVVFEPNARAYDGVSATVRDEFARKVRTLAGNFQLFAREPWLLWPSENRLWLQTVSHKALRLALPVLFLLALSTNLMLAPQAPIYAAILLAQALFYLAALAGWQWPALRARFRLVVVPYTICFLTCATIMAFVRVVRGGQRVTWERAAINEPG
jgi:cellulose synthase/poly-beta-1,6-N-acetylglucosamine synthase-like glycosyltransferase